MNPLFSTSGITAGIVQEPVPHRLISCPLFGNSNSRHGRATNAMRWAKRRHGAGEYRELYIASEAWSSLAKGSKPVEIVVDEVARPLIEEQGLELVDVELVKEGANRYLRLFIDKEGGVTFDDCEAISRAVDAKLDAIWPNPPYEFFEVSSPGLERPLKRDEDFARYAGHVVAATTYAPVDGQKLFVGELVGLADGKVVLRLTQGKSAGAEIALDRKQVAACRLHVEF